MLPEAPIMDRRINNPLFPLNLKKKISSVFLIGHAWCFRNYKHFFEKSCRRSVIPTISTHVPSINGCWIWIVNAISVLLKIHRKSYTQIYIGIIKCNSHIPFGNGDSILLRHAAMGWANNPITRYCIQLIKTGLTELRCLTATLVPVLKKADAKQIAKPTNGFKPYITFRQLGLLFLPWFSFRAAIIFPGLLSLCQLTMGWNPKILCNFDKAALFTTKKFQEKKFKRWSRRSLRGREKHLKTTSLSFEASFNIIHL